MDALDDAFLAELAAVMGADLDGLFEAFENNTQAQLQTLQAALHDGDAEAVRRVAHSLKGAAASVGASAVSSQFLCLEQCAKRGELRRAEAELTVARTLFAQAMMQLQRWQDRSRAINPG